MSIGVALGYGTSTITPLGKRELHEVVEYTFRTIVRCTFGQLDDADQVCDRRNASCDFPEGCLFLCCSCNVLCSTWRVARGRRRGLDVLLVMLVIGRYERSVLELYETEKSVPMIADCMEYSGMWTKQTMGDRRAFDKTSRVSSTHTYSLGSSALSSCKGSNKVVVRNLVARIHSMRDGCHYRRRSPKLGFCVVISFAGTF